MADFGGAHQLAQPLHSTTEEEDEEEQYDYHEFSLLTPLPGDEVMLNIADAAGLEALELLQRRGFEIVCTDPETGRVLLQATVALHEEAGGSAQIVTDEDLEATKSMTVEPTDLDINPDWSHARGEIEFGVATADVCLASSGVDAVFSQFVDSSSIDLELIRVKDCSVRFRARSRLLERTRATASSMVKSEKEEFSITVEEGNVQDPYVEAVLRSTYSWEEEFIQFRLSLVALRFGVENCFDRPRKRGYFVYRVDVKAKPRLTNSEGCELLSATPDESSKRPDFQEQNTDTTTVGVGVHTRDLDFTVNRNHGISRSETLEKHGWKPSKLLREDPPAVMWTWEIRRWQDYQVFDSQNPQRFKWDMFNCTVPSLPVSDPESVQLIVGGTAALWQAPRLCVEPSEKLGWTISIGVYLALVEAPGKLKGALGWYTRRAKKEKWEIVCEKVAELDVGAG